MLNNWLNPLSEELRDFVTLLNQNQSGTSIQTYSEDFPELRSGQIAILGLGNFADAIRKSLYSMENIGKLEIVDLGNCACLQPEGIVPVINELKDSGLIPIILGGNDALVSELQVALHQEVEKSHPLFIDEKIAFGKVLQRSYINQLVESNIQWSGLTVIGYQKHLSSPEFLNKENDTIFHAMRLGQIKADPRIMEPYIRDCSSLSFSLNALKKAESPNKTGFNPSGLDSETACQICRYAGINEQMSSVLFHGFNTETEECEQTASLIAQMIWYFLDGVKNRIGEFPINASHLTEYVVSSSLSEEPIHFYKSMMTGRWWMGHPNHIGDYQQMIPCTYEEYLSACRDEVPDRLMHILSSI